MTTTTTITRDDVIDVVTKVVHENRERTNNGYCEYLNVDRQPNCIAGVALTHLGLDAEDIDEFDGLNIYDLSEDLRSFHGFTLDAVELLDRLQAHADNRWENGRHIYGMETPSGTVPWGKVLDAVIAEESSK